MLHAPLDSIPLPGCRIVSYTHKASVALAVQAKQDHFMFGDRLKVSSAVFSAPTAAVQHHKGRAEVPSIDTVGPVRYCSAACPRAPLASSLPKTAELTLN